MRFETKTTRTYQEMNSVCCSYFVVDLGVNQTYVGLDECDKGLATLDELCERLIRREEPVIESGEKKFSPALPCKIREISARSVILALLLLRLVLTTTFCNPFSFVSVLTLPEVAGTFGAALADGFDGRIGTNGSSSETTSVTSYSTPVNNLIT